MELGRVLLLLPYMTYSQGIIGNRIPSLCLTTEGERCMFPFIYKGQKYHKCTYTNSPSPWCSTLLDSDGTAVINRWGDCSTSADSACEVESTNLLTCTTSGGPSPNMPCIFPFRHNGVTYTTCTTDNLGQPWCSTAIYNNGSHQHGQGKYGLCPSTCPGAEGFIANCVPSTTWTKDCNTCTCSSTGQSVCTTNTCRSTTCTPGSTWKDDCNTCVCGDTSTPVCTKNKCPGTCRVVSGPAMGTPCVFPFSWGGKTYNRCTPWTYGGSDQGKDWCSTKTNEEDMHVNGEGNYGFCGPDCPVVTDSSRISDRINLVNNDAIVFEENPNPPPN